MSEGQFPGFVYPEAHRHQPLRKERFDVAPGVHVFSGYSTSVFSALIGPAGWLLVDSGSNPAGAAAALEEVRALTDWPLLGVFLTHSHPDHRGGAAFFLEQYPGVPVWGRANFGAEQAGFKGLENIAAKRGARQFGVHIPDELYTANSLLPRFAGGDAPGRPVLPDRLLDSPEQELELAGFRLELYAAPGETPDHLAVWLPEQKVLFGGDNVYRSFPNIYPVRGSGFRDLGTWAATVRRYAEFGAKTLVMGHGAPAMGAEVAEIVADYAEAIQFVLDETRRGMDAGLSADELAVSVRLPERLREKPYLAEYYGSVPWAVRSVFAGLLGWFDGNPSRLVSLAPGEEAARMADLAGGGESLLQKAKAALQDGDYPWAAQLCDYLLRLGGPQEADARLLKAEALEGLSRLVLPISGKNYLLSCALELRKG